MINRKWLSLSVLACIGCCAMPSIIGASTGIVAITAMNADFWICASVLIVAVALWYATQHRRKTQCVNTGGDRCSTDCSCKKSG
jgi:hypothetical protein